MLNCGKTENDVRAPEANEVSPGVQNIPRFATSSVANTLPKPFLWIPSRSFVAEPRRGADKPRVKYSHQPLACNRLASIVASCILLALGAGGCATEPAASSLATSRRQAEIAVTNLTPHAWRIALRSPQGADIKTVEVKPRESLAMVVDGGSYVVEQTLVTADSAAGEKRNFNARFEPGERYRWSLATLLTAEEPVAP